MLPKYQGTCSTNFMLNQRRSTKFSNGSTEIEFLTRKKMAFEKSASEKSTYSYFESQYDAILVMTHLNKLIQKRRTTDEMNAEFLNNTIVLEDCVRLIAHHYMSNGEEIEYLGNEKKGSIDFGSKNELLPHHREFIIKWQALVDKHYSDAQIKIDKLADYMHLSPGHLLDKLKMTIGKKPSDYLREFRINKAIYLMTTEAISITDIAEAVGFSSLAYFSSVFKKITTFTPNEFRQKLHAREKI